MRFCRFRIRAGRDGRRYECCEKYSLRRVSPISMDHIGVIGNTLSEIAENKAGIIKPGCIVVSAPQKQEVREILEQKARQFGCPIIYAEPEKAVVLEEDYRGMRFSYKDSENISIRLSGKYQLINAVTAWEAVHVPGLLKKEEKRAVETGFSIQNGSEGLHVFRSGLYFS